MLAKQGNNFLGESFHMVKWAVPIEQVDVIASKKTLKELSAGISVLEHLLGVGPKVFLEITAQFGHWVADSNHAVQGILSECHQVVATRLLSSNCQHFALFTLGLDHDFPQH